MPTEPALGALPPPAGGLPPGFGLVLDGGTVRANDGHVLVGGTPPRVVRLSEAGRRQLERLLGGGVVGPSDPAAAALARRLTAAGIAHPRPPAALPPLTVAVVVPVRDDPAGLARLFDSPGWSAPGLPSVLDEQDRPPDGAAPRVAAVIVVDDGSSDPRAVATAATAAMPTARLLRHETCRGPAAARSSGLAAVTSDLVAFVDADVTLPAGWLAPLVAHFADPMVAAVAPRVVADEPAPDPASALRQAPRTADHQRCRRQAPGTARRPQDLLAYERLRSPLDLGARPAVVRPGGPVPYVPSAVLVCRRSALQAVGGFDPLLRVGEDVDLVWRLDRSGFVVRYEPAVAVGHAVRPTLAAWLRQRFAYGTSAAVLARRHPGRLAPVRTSPATVALWAAVASGRPVLGGLLGAAPTPALARQLGGVRHPYVVAARLLGRGHLAGGTGLAAAARREWWLLTVTALRWRRARPAAAVCLVGLPAVPWFRQRPPLALWRWLALHLADDAAYGAGVWWGCARHRTVAPLVPTVVAVGRRRGRPPASTG